MEKEFINYIEALALKELGFNEPCVAIFGRNNELSVDDGFYKQENYHKDTVLAPTYSQAFRWFREQHKLISSVDIAEEGTEQEHYFVTISTQGSYGFFKTYEEAELECLKTLMKIVKERNQ